MGIFFIKGVIIGFSIAAPVGPIGLLCIQRTVAHGRISGLLTGLGAATADGFYGIVAAFGLVTVSNFFIGQQFWFRLIGGIFLLYLGTKTFVHKPGEKTTEAKHKNLLSDYLSAVLLTLTNPTTILSFIAVFAGLGLGGDKRDLYSAILMAAGVFVGSGLWWFILSGGVSLFKEKINATTFGVINKFSGLIIFTFGLFALIGILRP